jgi:hypothetical protein
MEIKTPIDPSYDDDIFNPNNWKMYDELYLGSRKSIFKADVIEAFYCKLDFDDYLWAKQFCWGWTWSSVMPSKVYARRSSLKKDDLPKRTIYLHREIMMRIQPLPEYIAKLLRVDHINGNSLDNRKENLRWATAGMNSSNIHGQAFKEPDLIKYCHNQLGIYVLNKSQLVVEKKPKPLLDKKVPEQLSLFGNLKIHRKKNKSKLKRAA